MKNQIIITLGREHGSGGHYIADMIAQELGIKLYDKDSIEKEIVSEGYSEEMIRKMDEKPVNFFASRRIGKYSNSLEVNVAEKTFAMLRDKAANGESFLIIGRCSDQVLKGNPNMLTHGALYLADRPPPPRQIHSPHRGYRSGPSGRGRGRRHLQDHGRMRP